MQKKTGKAQSSPHACWALAETGDLEDIVDYELLFQDVLSTFC